MTVRARSSLVPGHANRLPNIYQLGASISGTIIVLPRKVIRARLGEQRAPEPRPGVSSFLCDVGTTNLPGSLVFKGCDDRE